MFNVARRPTFRREVKVQIPDKDGHDVESFDAEFEGLTAGELAGFDLATDAGTRLFLDRVFGWCSGVTDDSGRELPFSADLKERLLAWPFVRVALARAYFEGIAGARAGN